MRAWIVLTAIVLTTGLAIRSFSDEETGAPQAGEKKVNVRYKRGRDINFEELLIQGQLKRPEITVVTGNTTQGTDGLLRLRENFLDRTTADIGEEVK